MATTTDWTSFCRWWVRLGSRMHREMLHAKNCADGCHVSCGIDPDKPKTAAYWQARGDD